MKNRVQKFFSWLAMNIFLPLCPVFIKFVIWVFAVSGRKSVVIFDSVELLYYNLVICVTFLNLSGENNSMRSGVYIIRYGFILIIVLDLILIFINYTGMASDKCFAVSMILSVFVPVTVSVYQWKNMKNESWNNDNQSQKKVC